MPDCMPLLAVCDFTMGQSPSSDTYNTNGDGMPFYQGNADFGKRSPSPRVWCNSPKKTANEGDILISVRAPIGAINIAAEQCCIGRGLAALAVRPDAATRDYLEHYLRYKRPELERRGTGSTFKAVGKKVFAEMTLPIVSVDEQSEIAKKLNNALELQEEAASQISMLDELVKSRFVEMFGDPIENPKQLPIMRIDEIADVQTGATPLRGNAAYYGGSIPWVKTGEVAAGLLEEAEETITELALQETNCKLFPAGTILVAMYGQGDTRGKAAILRYAAATNQACAAILLNEGYDADFILAQLNLRYKDLRSRSLGGNQQNLSLKIIKAYELIVPSTEQQREFMAFVQQVDKLKFETQQAIEKLQLLYDSLAQEYFGS